MNYQKIHDAIINGAKTRTLTDYKERHHITPRCMGGDNSKSNLVDLTAREHFIIHKLLCEIYPDNDKLHYALWMMSNMKYKNRNYNIDSREYERIRKSYIEKHKQRLTNRNVTDETCQKISISKLGHFVSDETKKKISESLKGKVGTWNGRTHSLESKKKMSDAAKLRKASPETKKKMSLNRLGKYHSDESKQKMSKAALGKPKTKFTCSYCGKVIGGHSNIIRHENSHKHTN